MSRRICVKLYDEIVELRPDWHSEDDDKGAIKIVMTGAASDPPHGSSTLAASAAATRWRSGRAIPATR